VPSSLLFSKLAWGLKLDRREARWLGQSKTVKALKNTRLKITLVQAWPLRPQVRWPASPSSLLAACIKVLPVLTTSQALVRYSEEYLSRKLLVSGSTSHSMPPYVCLKPVPSLNWMTPVAVRMTTIFNGRQRGDSVSTFSRRGGGNGVKFQKSSFWSPKKHFLGGNDIMIIVRGCFPRMQRVCFCCLNIRWFLRLESVTYIGMNEHGLSGLLQGQIRQSYQETRDFSS